ncbi:hypothetical protein MIR68_007645 [Amoeboaphelidium protococcarum]|nr:hypothetical protein MIR68_007645 [Amoeboaphelidium protococcarum]
MADEEFIDPLGQTDGSDLFGDNMVSTGNQGGKSSLFDDTEDLRSFGSRGRLGRRFNNDDMQSSSTQQLQGTESADQIFSAIDQNEQDYTESTPFLSSYPDIIKQQDVEGGDNDTTGNSTTRRKKDKAVKYGGGGRRPWYRRKCFAVILLIILLLIITMSLITWFVIIPSVASQKMRLVGLKVNSIVMTKPRPSSVALRMNVTLEGLGAATQLSQKILSERTQIQVNFNGTEIGRVPMPELAIEKGMDTLDLIIDEVMEVTNSEWLTINIKDVLDKEVFYWNLKAPRGLHLKLEGVPVLNTISVGNVEFNKDIKLTGMQKFSTDGGFKVLSLEIPRNLNWQKDQVKQSSTRYQGLELQVQIQIPNPSRITMLLPDTTFSLYYKSTKHENYFIPVGLLSASSDEMLIRPSPVQNNITLVGGLLSYQTLPEALKYGYGEAQYRDVLSEFFTRYISGEKVDLQTRGFSFTDEFNSLRNHTKPDLPPVDSAGWLLNPLSQINLNVTYQHDSERNGRTSINGIQVDKLNFKFRKDYPFKPVTAGTIQARMFVPYLFDLDVVQVKQRVEIWRCVSSCTDLVLIGLLETQWEDSKSSTIETVDSELQDGSTLAIGKSYNVIMSINNSTMGRSDNTILQVSAQSRTYYQEFIRDLLKYEYVDVLFKGSASANIDLGLGLPLYVMDLPVDHSVRLPGMANLVSGGGDGMKVVQNLEVKSVARGGVLGFSIAGAYMRRYLNWTIGIEIDAPMQFDMFYTPNSDPTSGKHVQTLQQSQSIMDKDYLVGKVSIPSLNLGDTADCYQRIYDPLANETIIVGDSGVDYCSVVADGDFQPVASVRDQEICDQRGTCVSRAFFSAYTTNYALHRNTSRFEPTEITLKAVSLPPDFELAKSLMSLPKLQLPGYRPSYNATSRPPFPLVRRIVVQPTGNIISGKLSCWLDLYNPLKIPLRYHYLNIKTYYGNVQIGSLNVNLTQYDPFEHKKGYEFSGYPNRRTNKKKDPYGPHASRWCLNQQDCQVGPIDLVPNGVDGLDCTGGYQNLSTISNRTEVTFSLSVPGVAQFWKSLWDRDGAAVNVTIKGQVLIGLNSVPFVGQPRLNNTDPPSEKEIDDVKHGRIPADLVDPYWFGVQDFEKSNTFITWQDFGQFETPLIMRRFINGGNGRPEPLNFTVPGCDEN